MKKNEVITRIIFAEVIDKEEVEYTNLGVNGGIPTPSTMYEIKMHTDKSDYTFDVSEFEYAVLSVGDKGMLKMKSDKYRNELVSFSDKIKEFQM